METLCPVCQATATSSDTRIPPDQPVRVVDGVDTWLVPCASHGAGEVAASLDGFQNAQGEPLAAEVPA